MNCTTVSKNGRMNYNRVKTCSDTKLRKDDEKFFTKEFLKSTAYRNAIRALKLSMHDNPMRECMKKYEANFYHQITSKSDEVEKCASGHKLINKMNPHSTTSVLDKDKMITTIIWKNEEL